MAVRRIRTFAVNFWGIFLAFLVLAPSTVMLSAEDGQDALEQSYRHADEVHLVVSDVIMPRVNGWDVLGTIHRTHPGIEALFVSGYTGGSSGTRTW